MAIKVLFSYKLGADTTGPGVSAYTVREDTPEERERDDGGLRRIVRVQNARGYMSKFGCVYMYGRKIVHCWGNVNSVPTYCGGTHVYLPGQSVFSLASPVYDHMRSVARRQDVFNEDYAEAERAWGAVLSASILAAFRTTQAIFCGPVALDSYPTGLLLSGMAEFSRLNRELLTATDGQLQVVAPSSLDEERPSANGMIDRVSSSSSNLYNVAVWCPPKNQIIESGAVNPNSGNIVNTWPISAKTREQLHLGDQPFLAAEHRRPLLEALRMMLQENRIPKWVTITSQTRKNPENVEW